MFLVTKSFIIIFLVITAILLLSISMTLIVLLVKLHRMNNLTNEQSRVLYVMLTKQRNQDNRSIRMDNEISSVRKNIMSLSTSIDLVLKDYKRMEEQSIYPGPQLADMITSTIKEQIAIELTLSKNMRIPSKSSVNKIITNTIKTYPHVDRDYIVKKCLTLVEISNEQRLNKQQ